MKGLYRLKNGAHKESTRQYPPRQTGETRAVANPAKTGLRLLIAAANQGHTQGLGG